MWNHCNSTFVPSELPHTIFSDENILGKGGFGIVYKVRKTLWYGKIFNLYQTELNQTDWNYLIYTLFL